MQEIIYCTEKNPSNFYFFIKLCVTHIASRAENA